MPLLHGIQTHCNQDDNFLSTIEPTFGSLSGHNQLLQLMQVVVHLLLAELSVVRVQISVSLNDLPEQLLVIRTLSELLCHHLLHLQTLLLRLSSSLHDIPKVFLQLDVL